MFLPRVWYAQLPSDKSSNEKHMSDRHFAPPKYRMLSDQQYFSAYPAEVIV